MKKRGLSEVVTTLILVLLVLVAIAIVWVVISNLIRDKGGQVNVDRATIDLTVKKTQVAGGNFEIRFSRNVGGGDLRKVIISVTDGTNSQSFTEPLTIDEGEEQLVTVTPTNPAPESITSLSIIPVLGDNELKGEKKTFEVIIILIDYNYNDYVNNKLAPIHWWKFDDVPYFSEDSGTGTPLTATHGNEVTQDTIDFMQGYSVAFAGISPASVIGYGQIPSLITGHPFTISGFVKRQGTFNLYEAFGRGTINTRRLLIETSASARAVSTADPIPNYFSTSLIPVGAWTHIVYKYDGTNEKWYIEGIPAGTDNPATTGWDGGSNEIGNAGGSYPLKGNIDEYMIFDRALKDSEIQNLYTATKDGSVTA